MKNEILNYLNIKLENDFVNSIKLLDIDHIEHSVKVTEDEYIDERVLIKIQNIDYPLFQFRDIISSLTKNKSLIELCILHFVNCDNFKFEFEIRDDHIMCEAYFEVLMTEERKQHIKSKRLVRGETCVSFKWKLNSDIFLTNKQECVIRLNRKIIPRFLHETGVPEFFDFSMNQLVRRNIDYMMIVNEQNCNKKIIELKFRNAISIFHISPTLKPFNKIHKLYDKLYEYRMMKIYHLLFGINENNKKFFTLYFEPYAILPQIDIIN